MDQISNVNLQVVHDAFPIKYGPKTLKHTWSISLKTLGHFKITMLKYDEKSMLVSSLNIDKNALKKI